MYPVHHKNTQAADWSCLQEIRLIFHVSHGLGKIQRVLEEHLITELGPNLQLSHGLVNV